MPTSRNSKQKDAVYNNLLNRYDHPTAEEVYLSIKKEIPSISLATVYRNLCSLRDSGRISAINCPSAVHYDGHTEEHSHAICSICGKIFDLPISMPGSLLKEATDGFPGKIDGYSLIFSGICEKCQTKNS